MEPTTSNVSTKTDYEQVLHTVTPLSKYLAMVLFVVMPFVGVYVGYQFGVAKHQFESITPPSAVSTNDAVKTTKSARAIDYGKLQQQYTEEFGVDIELLYVSPQSTLSYFKTLTYSSAAPRIVRYDAGTNAFSQTEFRIDYAIGESASGNGRYITKIDAYLRPTTTVTILDLESESEVATVRVGEGETLWSGICGYAGPAFSLSWVGSSTLRYGVYQQASIGTVECDTTLIEYRDEVL